MIHTSRLPFALFGTTDPKDICCWILRYLDTNNYKHPSAFRVRYDNIIKCDKMVVQGLADGRSPDAWQRAADDQIEDREELIHEMCAFLNKQRPTALFGRIPGTSMSWGWYAKEKTG